MRVLALLLLFFAEALRDVNGRYSVAHAQQSRSVSGENGDSKFSTRGSSADGGLSSYEAGLNGFASTHGANQMKTLDPCYDQDGRARRCVSEFGNVALGRQAAATSTCGSPPTRYCSQTADNSGKFVKQCQLCDAKNRKRAHPAAFLVDVHQDKPSCWMSETFVEHHPPNVSVTVSLDKKYEVSYIVLPFCNKLPESMTLYKSADFGKSWLPLQFYSSQCKRMYGMHADGVITRANEQEAVCKDLYSSTDPYRNIRIAFSLVDGRPSAHNQDNSPVLRDWMTLTDIMVVFNRLNSPSEPPADRDYNYYSLSDITLGGRCKCNGHASKCAVNGEGRPVCECKHNTAGDDCERCKPFHFDRPWDRANNENANECIACNCNLHSRHCSFSKDLFLLSGRISGGVCVNCRHNTAGRHCHYCAEGFYRDYAKPVNHRRVCKDCKCHPYGSVGKTCNQSTGQCFCKDGVMGLRCDRCRPGYVMSRNPITPCEKDPMRVGTNDGEGVPIPLAFSEENAVPINTRDLDYSETSFSEEECGTCRRDSLKLDMSKYCKSTFAMQAQVTKKESSSGGWAKFTVTIYDVYKKSEVGSARTRARRGEQFVYVQDRDLACNCPRVKVGKQYLMVGTDSKEKDGVTLDRDAIVVPFEAEFERRIRHYMKSEKESSCLA